VTALTFEEYHDIRFFQVNYMVNGDVWQKDDIQSYPHMVLYLNIEVIFQERAKQHVSN
jgi:hypothetical protein